MVKREEGIHKFELRYRRMLDYLKDPIDNKTNQNLGKFRTGQANVRITKHNRDIILEFEKQLCLERLSLPRKLKIMESLISLDKIYFHKPFDDVTRKNMEEVVYAIEKADYSPWTKQGYKVVLKKFYKWLAYKGDYTDKLKPYPETVAWINTNVRKRETPMIKEKDILSEDDISLMISAADHPRDKAFLGVLWDTATRVSEIGNIKLSDIRVKDRLIEIDVFGKTGGRTVYVVKYASYLRDWMDYHPSKKDRNAPLWVNKRTGEAIDYAAINKLLRDLAARAGIRKRVNPHIFRHSSFTEMSRHKAVSEAMAKKLMGWARDSKMPGHYEHLTSSDARDAILAVNGLEPDQDNKIHNAPIKCGMCGDINPPERTLCGRCGRVLRTETAVKIQQVVSDIDLLLLDILKKNITPEMLSKIKKGILGKE